MSEDEKKELELRNVFGETSDTLKFVVKVFEQKEKELI